MLEAVGFFFYIKLECQKVCTSKGLLYKQLCNEAVIFVIIDQHLKIRKIIRRKASSVYLISVCTLIVLHHPIVLDNRPSL